MAREAGKSQFIPSLLHHLPIVGTIFYLKHHFVSDLHQNSAALNFVA